MTGIKAYRDWYSPVAVWILRVVLGIVFIMSGFSKGVDPWGFIFKLEDYCAVWGITQPRTLLLVETIALSAFEFVTGFLLACGCYKRTAPWLMTALMGVLTPLTLYIWIDNPVSDCGCFGEMIILSNPATFWKNVVLTAGLIYLCIYNNRCHSAIYAPAIQWIVGATVTLYIIIVSLYGYNLQPFVDFRPYPVGTNLAALLNDDDDEITDMKYIYEKDGQRRTFTIDRLPDSTWTFLDRIDVKIADKAGFAIYNGEENVTEEVIKDRGEQLILVIPEETRADIAYTYAANELYKAMGPDEDAMIALIAASTDGIDQWRGLSMAAYPCYSVEDTSLKQLARGNMSLVYLRDGIIQWKTSLSHFDFDTIDRLGDHEIAIKDLNIQTQKIFKNLSWRFGAFLVLLALFQQFIIRIFRKTKKLRKFAVTENNSKPQIKEET